MTLYVPYIEFVTLFEVSQELTASNDLFSHTLQRAATHRNTMQHTARLNHICSLSLHTLQHTATCCNTLQYTGTHCNTLQHTAIHYNTLQHTNSASYFLSPPIYTATHSTRFNTLLHAAIRCNTLQHAEKILQRSSRFLSLPT